MIYIPPFLKLIEDDIKSVEDILSSDLLAAVRTVDQVSREIVQAGGKRLRASLVILSANSVVGEFDRERLLRIAACMEIAHMATLMHDDVVDEADSRRGRTTANVRWGNQVSVLSGDYMVAKVFSILAQDGDPEVMRALSDATVSMTEGELRQLESLNDIRAQIAQYPSLIKDKTAMFMSACCKLGGVIAKSDGRTRESLAEFGMEFGMAFQITDDLLDLIGDPAQTGKPIGGDIREGKITMPVIFALDKANPSEAAEVERILYSGAPTTSEIDFVRELAERTGAIEQTRGSAAQFIRKATDALSGLSASDARDCLAELAERILDRNF
jgi:geranylgeranyl pyrophosphate synthase